MNDFSYLLNESFSLPPYMYLYFCSRDRNRFVNAKKQNANEKFI